MRFRTTHFFLALFLLGHSCASFAEDDGDIHEAPAFVPGGGGRPEFNPNNLLRNQQRAIDMSRGGIQPEAFQRIFSQIQSAQDGTEQQRLAGELGNLVDRSGLLNNQQLQNSDGSPNLDSLSNLFCLNNLNNDQAGAIRDAFERLGARPPGPVNGDANNNDGSDAKPKDEAPGEHTASGSPVRTGALAGINAGVGNHDSHDLALNGSSSPVRQHSTRFKKNNPGGGEGDGAGPENGFNDQGACQPPGDNNVNNPPPLANNDRANRNPNRRDPGAGTPPGGGSGAQIPPLVPGQMPERSKMDPLDRPDPIDVKPFAPMKLPPPLEETSYLSAIAGIKFDGSYDSSAFYKSLDDMQKNFANSIPKFDPPTFPQQFMPPQQQQQQSPPATQNYNASKLLNLGGPNLQSGFGSLLRRSNPLIRSQ